MLGFLLGVAVFALDVWAILNVFRSNSSDGAKIGWLIGILVFPVIGFIAWMAAGPKDTRRLPRY